jgi:hypothetical protein
MWHNIFNGLLPWYHNALYIYSVLDMISRPHSVDPGDRCCADNGLARRKILTASSGRFGSPPQGNAEARDGLAPAAQAIICGVA